LNIQFKTASAKIQNIAELFVSSKYIPKMLSSQTPACVQNALSGVGHLSPVDDSMLNLCPAFSRRSVAKHRAWSIAPELDVSQIYRKRPNPTYKKMRNPTRPTFWSWMS